MYQIFLQECLKLYFYILKDGMYFSISLFLIPLEICRQIKWKQKIETNVLELISVFLFHLLFTVAIDKANRTSLLTVLTLKTDPYFFLIRDWCFTLQLNVQPQSNSHLFVYFTHFTYSRRKECTLSHTIRLFIQLHLDILYL